MTLSLSNHATCPSLIWGGVAHRVLKSQGQTSRLSQCLLGGSFDPSRKGCLQQAVVMLNVDVNEKAKTVDFEVGDNEMVCGQRVTPLTAKWDHHYIVTQVRGKVITVLHVPTGKVQRWNRNKIRIVDPEISWEGVRIRPRAQNIVRATTSAFAGAVHPQSMEPLLPWPERQRKRAAPLDHEQPNRAKRRANEENRG